MESAPGGYSTVERTIVAAENPRNGYTNLTFGPGEPYLLRDGAREDNAAIPNAQPDRAQRRRSLAYVSQLTDFQLADEESPARVEFVDPGPASAWRPQEGFTAFQIEMTIRQINHFAPASPIVQGDGTRAGMDFALLTGDQADNQHLNETVWVRDLLEGNGPANFNSGVTDPAEYTVPKLASQPSCLAYLAQMGGNAQAAAAEAARYTGVQDYDDYPASPPVTPLYYDPDHPMGPDWADWPEYEGLMDRAQEISFTPTGLAVPFYITNGNHDVLVQGNEDANQAFEDIATGCFKALATTNDPTQPAPPDGPDPNYLLSAANVGMLVPPDPDRRFVAKPEIKQLYGATDEGPGDDDHGFKHVDPAENQASRGSASYYAWDPARTPGMRFISIDTNSEGGQTAESFVPGQPSTPGSSNGNLDHPQFVWLKNELARAKARDQLVVLFGHHPVRSLNTEIRDEQAAPCTGVPDEHGHDVNVGCDLDPRPSFDANGCIHNGTDQQNQTCSDAQHESFVELLDQFPNVIAYVPGHTHEHRLTPFVRPDGSTWWEINTSAVIDYPNQSRLVEFMDNRDGTLSIFNTVVDHAAAATAPAACSAADCTDGFGVDELASIGRTFTFNDPDNDFSGRGRTAGDGRPIDRNAELLLEDPRPEIDLALTKTDSPDPVPVGQELTYRLVVTNPTARVAREVVLTDDLPAGVDLVSATGGGPCTAEGRQVRCEVGNVPADSVANVTIKVIPREQGRITNRARVRGNVSDRNAGNDAAEQTTTVGPAAMSSGQGAPSPGAPGGGSGGSGGAQNRYELPVACASRAGFASAAAQPARRRVHMLLSRRATAPAQVDVFQTSRGRRVVGQRLVARFDDVFGSFTWNGRANRPGRRVRDGYFFVRFRTRSAAGVADARRVALRRSRGRWSHRPAFYRSGSCSLVNAFRLERPVFGGRRRVPLRISYRLNRRATVRLEVRRGKRLVRRVRAIRARAGRTYRLRFAARGRARGDYRVTLRAGASRQTLVARRL